jgi:hypothetical protein
MDHENQTPNAATEIIPAPYSPPDPEEKTTEGRKEERAQQPDASTEAGNNGSNGNPAQSSGRVTAQEQNAHPEPTIEAEGDGGDTTEGTPQGENP